MLTTSSGILFFVHMLTTSSSFLFFLLLLIIIGVSHDEATSLGFLFFLHMLTTSSGFLFFLHMLTTSSSFLFFLLLIIISVSHDEATSLGFLFFLHMLITSSGFLFFLLLIVIHFVSAEINPAEKHARRQAAELARRRPPLPPHAPPPHPAARPGQPPSPRHLSPRQPPLLPCIRRRRRRPPATHTTARPQPPPPASSIFETMDANREAQEEFMANLIAGGVRDDGGGYDDVTTTYLNDSGEGAEDLERREDAPPSGSSKSSVKSKRGPAKKLPEGVRHDIVEIDQSGRPTAPAKAAKLFIDQCGVVVRDCIPITVREWHKPKAAAAEAGHYVDDVAKNNIWRRLMAHFNLPPEENADKARQMEEKVKEFALKKMAELFKNHKKRLYHDFVKQKKTPDFTGAYEKIKDHWPEFVKYTLSEEFKKRSETNKKNASLKKYHQVTGPGGYRANRPKWQAAEAELVRKGIQIGTFDWTERSKEWFYGIGGRLDPETGKCIYNKEHLKNPCEALIEAHRDVREGRFYPERENDELTRALANKEHGG
ncbi:hypothetical protein QYE76_036934 [Lolium multiflorum]|uniref:Uncharacterized protein n=1 Tax=Lolium multiflorum TaxID=4521 RepID=A0AAD8R2S3_LOLMU|nr:hypothetical protein QYE76_036934 [Lolium multiflorum]